MASASDVLAYIGWVWSLQRREQERFDCPEWQRDRSWDEIRARIGLNAAECPLPEPGQLTGSPAINAQLYWPDPDFSRCLRGFPSRRP